MSTSIGPGPLCQVLGDGAFDLAVEMSRSMPIMHRIREVSKVTPLQPLKKYRIPSEIIATLLERPPRHKAKGISKQC
jgi:hypothetical protein